MTLDEEEVLFHYELGQCLTEWSWVERQMAQAALACMPKTQHKAMLDGYFAIENFRSKMAFVDRIVCRKNPDPAARTRWTKVLARIKSASEERNKLAHRSFVMYPDGSGGRRTALVEWMVFMDAHWKREKPPKGNAPSGSKCIVDLLAFQNECKAIYRSLINASRELSGRQPPLSVAFEQVMGPKTVRDAERRFRVRTGRQPRPSKPKSSSVGG